jgi:GntR family transcriptional repressor for pyruvate dehydrogenase complex
MFPSAESTRVSEDTVQQIVALIRSHAYAPGTRLPGERQLAQQFQVSRTSVREAIRKLETAGLLETRPGLGTYIKDPSREVLNAALMPYLLLDRTKLSMLFELREIIEVEAAGRAAERATPDQVADMHRWAEAMEASVARNDIDGMVRADLGFHRQIIVATGNDVLVSLLDSISDLLREMRRASLSLPVLLENTVVGHREILAAVECGNSAEARQAMFSHLASVRSKVDMSSSQPAAAVPANGAATAGV